MTDTKTFNDDKSDHIWLETDKLQIYALWDKTTHNFQLTLERLDTHETLHVAFEKNVNYINVNKKNCAGWQANEFEFKWHKNEIKQLKRQDYFIDRYYESPAASTAFNYGFNSVNTTYYEPEDLTYEYILSPECPIKFSAILNDTKTTELFEKTRLSEYILADFNQHISDLCLDTNFEHLYNQNNLNVAIENIATMCDALLHRNVDLYEAREIYSRLRA